MIAYLDCTTGISGDKFLAALVDAGAPEAEVRAAISAIDSSIHVEFSEVTRAGVRGLSATVTATGNPVNRTWAEIRAILGDATLPEAVRDTALAVFELIASAEAAVHAVSPDEVHFHEVGAIDSIADVVGTAAALHALGVERLVCGPISVGSGTIETAHGVLPVPAPATALLLRDVPIHTGPLPGEATTPTGAALVRVCADAFGEIPSMVIEHVGHGAGSRDPQGVANVARLFLGIAGISTPGASPMTEEPVAELETAIDHLCAEHLAFACEDLLGAGALDVWQTPVTMKKGRAGTLIGVVCRDQDATRLATMLAELTGTLGVRIRRITRLVTERHRRTVETSLGAVRVKIAGSGEWQRARVEYEDIAAIARREGLSADIVSRRLDREIGDLLAENGDS